MFRFLTAGESHGPCLTAIIEGMPAGLALDHEKLNHELARRQRGYGRGGRMHIEQDKAEILSGVRFGQTLGSPITLTIHNRDWVNWELRMAAFGPQQGDAVLTPRPGHADLPGFLKYGRSDVRDILERASARETAARVAVGAVAKQLLAALGIEIGSHVTNIGGIIAEKQQMAAAQIQERVEHTELGCLDRQAEAQMKQAIDQAKLAGDTLGGIFEITASGLPAGLGSHVQWDRRLDTRIAAAVMSIPAIKGVEFGVGFGLANLPGSAAHDEIYFSEDKGFYRGSNQAGGLEGGISNGEDVIVRAVMKPIPTLMKPLNSVDLDTLSAAKANTERSDVCAVTAAAVVGEAMLAIALAEVVLEKFGGDTIEDLKQSVTYYRHRTGR
jgi:chorismate synthase